MIAAIRKAARADVDALAAKVDASHGYPRCDRLAGTIAPAEGRRPLACPCKDASAPDPTCTFSTRAEARPIELASGEWAYPVDLAAQETYAALSKSERGAVVDVPPGDVKQAPALAAPKGEAAPVGTKG